MSLFRDDFYSTKPSRSWAGRGAKSKSYQLAGIIALLIVGLLLIAIALMNRADDPSVVSDVRVITEAVDGEGAEKDRSDGGLPSMDGDRILKDAWSVDYGGYRSDVAAATAKAYEAVVSIVLPTEADSTDWQDIHAIGSGIIFSIEGNEALIVTNHHVVTTSPEVEIVLSDGSKKPAELVGGDAIADLAVLKVDAEGIKKVAVFGNSSDLQIGEKAIAIGNPLGLGYAHTITQGIISSTQRSIPVSLGNNGSLDWEMEVIQTDAAINSGNSGGALINIYGEVIGINTMKIAWFGVEGLGFAIPIDLARPVIEELIQYGKVIRPYIGIGAVNLMDYWGDELDLPDDVTEGAVIMTVDGPAKKAGLREKDVIVKLDDREIRNMIDLRKYLYSEKQIGELINVTLYRKGRERTFKFELGEMP